MPDEPFDIGDLITLRATFRENVDSAPTEADPTLVVCRVKKPDGNVSTPAVTNDAGLGKFSVEVALDQAGTWRYRFEGTGAVIAAGERRFRVRRSEVL